MKKDPSKRPNPNARRGAVRPDKRTMNFLRTGSMDFKRMLPVLLAAVVLLAIFVKLGILDPLSRKAEAYNALSLKQEQLAQINTKLADFDALQQQYCRYSFGLMNDTEVSLVSRMDVLSLVESKISPKAAIENFTVNNNLLTIHIWGVTLREASAIVSSLEASPLVSRATVNSATAEDGREARIFISITLTKPQEETE